MKKSTHIYPWDLAACGIEAVVNELAELGIGGINMAATYHPIAALSSRVPGRLLYCERGAVFFPARAARYGRIKPRVWPDRRVVDVWPDLAAARPAGMRITAWTITLFQPWIAAEFPDCARVLPCGDPVPAGVCPASPDVSEYLVNLAGDLADQVPLDALELEGAAYPRFDSGWVRPRILARLGAWEKRLLALCFCTHCKKLASGDGIDIEALRARVNAELSHGFERDDPQGGEKRYGEWLEQDPEFARFLTVRRAAVKGMIQSIARAASAAPTRPGLAVYEADVREAGGIEGLPVQTFRTGGRISPRRREKLCTIKAGNPDLGFKHTLMCGDEHGVPGGSPPLAEVIASLAGTPVDEVSFYNYGVISRRELLSALSSVRALG